MDAAPFSLFLVGLLGAGHCVGMCGGILVALGANAGPLRLLAYNLGRIASYVLAGIIAGLISSFAADYMALASVLRTIAAVLLILMGLYIADWWRLLSWLERVGTLLWRHIQPLAARLGRADTTFRALLLGMLWGWLPCGLVYSAIGFALASGSLASGALAMFAFGLGTLPAMLAGGLAASSLQHWLQKKSLRQLSGVLLILLGLWSLWTLQQHGGHPSQIEHNQHSHHLQH